MSDIVEGKERFEKIQMQDADVGYVRKLELGQSHEVIMRRLIDETPWRSEKITLWGKVHVQPRLMAWFGDVGAQYSYSQIKLDPLAWTETLTVIKERVEAVAGTIFNSVLINYYRDHRDSMGQHSDDEPELGSRPIIASLSLGEERILRFKHKSLAGVKAVEVPLGSGSVLLMRGETQRFWKHGINKLSRPCGPRVNLTFRRILINSSSTPSG